VRGFSAVAVAVTPDGAEVAVGRRVAAGGSSGACVVAVAVAGRAAAEARSAGWRRAPLGLEVGRAAGGNPDRGG